MEQVAGRQICITREEAELYGNPEQRHMHFMTGIRKEIMEFILIQQSGIPDIEFKWECWCTLQPQMEVYEGRRYFRSRGK